MSVGTELCATNSGPIARISHQSLAHYQLREETVSGLFAGTKATRNIRCALLAGTMMLPTMAVPQAAMAGDSDSGQLRADAIILAQAPAQAPAVDPQTGKPVPKGPPPKGAQPQLKGPQSAQPPAGAGPDPPAPGGAGPPPPGRSRWAAPGRATAEARCAAEEQSTGADQCCARRAAAARSSCAAAGCTAAEGRRAAQGHSTAPRQRRARRAAAARSRRTTARRASAEGRRAAEERSTAAG